MPRGRKPGPLKPFGRKRLHPRSRTNRHNKIGFDYLYINPQRVLLAKRVAGITNEEFWKAIGVGGSSVEKYLMDRRWPVHRFTILEDLFDLPAEWFRRPEPPQFRSDV